MNPFHPGEIAVQDRAGVAQIAGRVGRSIGDTMPPIAREWLALQRLGAVVALAPDGQVWAQLLSGEPGFFCAPDERTLEARAALDPDDPLQRALEGGADVGAIVLEPATRRRMRFNGRGTLGGQRLVIAARQVYSNCPKYIQARSVEAASPAPDAAPLVVAQGTGLGAGARAWISGADTFFIGSRCEEGGADCSHRGGNPGFVSVAQNTLSWPDYPGNAMFNTLGNLALDGRAGLVFPDWQSGAALQLAGEAQVIQDGDYRRVEFRVRAWRHVAGVLLAPWRFASYSSFNPL